MISPGLTLWVKNSISTIKEKSRESIEDNKKWYCQVLVVRKDRDILIEFYKHFNIIAKQNEDELEINQSSYESMSLWYDDIDLQKLEIYLKLS